MERSEALIWDTEQKSNQMKHVISNRGLIFGEREKLEYLKKTSQSRAEQRKQQTQPTYDIESWNRTWATLVGGECSHLCDFQGGGGGGVTLWQTEGLRHLNIVGCLLTKRLIKGWGGHGLPRTPPSYEFAHPCFP